MVGFSLEECGFTFCCISCQVPKMDKDLCGHSMRILCVESDLFFFSNVYICILLSYKIETER